MPNRSLPLLLLMVGACVTGFMGYHRGFGAAMEKPKVGKSQVTSDRREEQREARPDKMSRLRALGRRSDRSHSAMIESWRIIRGFSVDEVQQALAEMPQSHEGTMAGWQLTAMLHSRWAEIDPQAALESAVKCQDPNFPSTMIFNAALTAWMDRDPEAAYRWAKTKPEVSGNPYNRMMARMLANESPSSALDKASAEGEEMRKSVGGMLAANMSATPEGRAAFLAELSKRGPDELAAGKIQLLTAWGRDDPKGALEGIADLGLDPQLAIARREAIMSSWSRLDPASALAWMAGKPDALSLAKRTQVFTTWTRESPDEALKHFASLGSEPGFGEAVMTRLMLEDGKASLNLNSGGAPWIELNRTTLQACYQRWMAQAPEVASRWQESLDPDLKRELQPTASHENH